MNPQLRAAFDKAVAADRAHQAATEALNQAILELVNLAASQAKPPA